MSEYEMPILDVIRFIPLDIITASGEDDEGHENGDD